MSRDELWALINHHADMIKTARYHGPYGAPTPICFGQMSRHALEAEQHAQRIADLCKEAYHLERKYEEEQMLENQARCGEKSRG